jgi:NitT/TauT family transport system substrate-binding protein
MGKVFLYDVTKRCLRRLFEASSIAPLVKLFSLAFFIVFLQGLGSLTFSLAEGADRAPLKKVRFLPQWLPQAQFAGYYAAQEKGFFKSRGIEIEILRGGPQIPPSEALSTGKADFVTLFLANGIVQRASGLDIVNIGQIVQKSAYMIVARRSFGIERPQDLEGKKVGLWGGELDLLPRAFFRKFNISVRVIPQGPTMNLFLRGGVHAASAMWYNEYHQIINSGVDPQELTTFLLSDYGMSFPEDGIYCLERTFLSDPALCEDFLLASLEGWRYALQHPDETVDMVMRHANAAHVATNRVHQAWMLSRMKDIIAFKGAPELGLLSYESYEEVARALEDAGIIDHRPEYAGFYKEARKTAPQVK